MIWQPSDYTLYTVNGSASYVLRSDGASIPIDGSNADYTVYLQVTAGQTVATVELNNASSKWTNILSQRDQKFMSQLHVLGELVLYLAETQAVQAGKITDGQRSVTAARALSIAMYMRQLYQITASGNPDTFTWPAAP